MAHDKPVGRQPRRADVANTPTHPDRPAGQGVEPSTGRHDPPRTPGTRRSRATTAKRQAQARDYLQQVDALTARISAAWTGDGSAVDAIREQRREL